MTKVETPLRKRVNVSLSRETLKLLHRVSKNRSRFIDAAVHHYAAFGGRARLRKMLAEGYRRGADRDLAIATEWFSLEEGEV